MTLYRSTYRIESIRLKDWDYSRNGYYFVTICTQNKEYMFGDVIDGTIQLSIIGRIIEEEWKRTEQIRSNVTLDKWIIMPNHLHGIIIINNPVETSRWDVSKITNGQKGEILQKNETSHRDVSTGKLKCGSLGAIIGQFKSICTKRIWKIRSDFAWQSRFYDHIIRNEESLNKTREYIISNPSNWEADKDNPANLYM